MQGIADVGWVLF